MKLSTWFLQAILLFVLSISFTTTLKAQDANYLPLAVGNSWSYEWNITNSATIIYNTEILKDNVVEGIRTFQFSDEVYTIEDGVEGERDTSYNRYYKIFPCERVITRNAMVLAGAKIPILPIDLEEGIYSVPEETEVDLEFKYVGEFYVPAGIFENCYHARAFIHVEGEFEYDIEYANFIIAPNVGIIADGYDEETGEIDGLVLTRYNISQESINERFEEFKPSINAAHYHKLDRKFSFQEPKEDFQTPLKLNTIESNIIIDTFQICSDGSDASIFEFTLPEGDYDITKLEVSILEDEEGNINKYGEFQFGERVSDNKYKVRYLHPSFVEFPENKKEVRYTISVFLDLDNTCFSAEFPLKVYPPPVLMIHGLWGNKSAFDALENFLGQKKFHPKLLLKADYKNSNNVSLKKNIETNKVLRKHINELFYSARKNNISAGKVNIVGHSMGGLLTRYYLNKEFYRGDIDKVITCNTPHYGSQAANLLQDVDFLTVQNFYCKVVRTPYNIFFGIDDCFDGAINDLKIWERNQNNAIYNLFENNATNAVPFHLIASTETLSGAASDAIGLGLNQLEKKVLSFFVTKLIGIGIGLEALYKDQHDIIVPLISQSIQTEGIHTKEYITPISGQQHMGSVANDKIMKEIEKILLADAQSNKFTDNLPQPFDAPLDYFLDIGENIASVQNQKTNANIIITSNVNDINYEGDTVIFNIQGSEEIRKMEIEFFEENTIYKEIIDTNKIIFKYKIPPYPLGYRDITVSGYDKEGKLIALEVSHFFVSTDQTPNSIIVDNRERFIEQYEEKNISVEAVFNGYKTDISQLPNLEFIFKNNLLEHRGIGVIKANEIGEDTLIIKYKGVSSEPIPIEVVPADTSDTSTNTEEIGKTIQANTIKIFPNPTNNVLNIEMENQETIEVLISILDLNGKKILEKQTTISPNNKVEQIETSNLSSGIYFISVSSKQGIQTSKFIKS